MKARFDGKVIVITGVNDRGIGGAIAERFAEEGGTLVLLWYERPNRLLNRLQKLGARVIDRSCDVTSTSSVRECIKAVIDECPQIDVLINNAGVDTSKPLEQISEDEWDQQIDVNLTGAMRVTQQVLPHLTSPGAAIVSLASVLGLAGCAGFSAYSASKAGLIGFTQSLAMELAPRGIRAVCVAPALVFTPMSLKRMRDRSAQVEQQIAATHPLGVGSPHDVAGPVAFLASDEARWITGVTLPLGWVPSFPLPLSE